VGVLFFSQREREQEQEEEKYINNGTSGLTRKYFA
jgi:hypothetical protein